MDRTPITFNPLLGGKGGGVLQWQKLHIGRCKSGLVPFQQLLLLMFTLHCPFDSNRNKVGNTPSVKLKVAEVFSSMVITREFLYFYKMTHHFCFHS